MRDAGATRAVRIRGTCGLRAGQAHVSVAPTLACSRSTAAVCVGRTGAFSSSKSLDNVVEHLDVPAPAADLVVVLSTTGPVAIARIVSDDYIVRLEDVDALTSIVEDDVALDQR